MTTRFWLLLIAKPGSLRDSLRALLATIPGIQTVEVDDVGSAMEAIKEYQPTLLLVDLGPSADSVWDSLSQIKSGWPSVRYVLLADSVQQQQWAQATGADIVLLKGLPASRLVATINRLLPQTDGTQTSILGKNLTTGKVS